MIALTPQLRVLVANVLAAFRCRTDGRMRQVLTDDPMNGVLFILRSRRGTAVKVLFYDGQDLWLCQKRWSQGRFQHWRSGPSGQRLRVLLAGGDWRASTGGTGMAGAAPRRGVTRRRWTPWRA